MEKKKFSLFFFVLVMLFFYLPIVMLIVLSFNSTKAYEFKSFSLRWYIELFTRSPKLWQAFGRSILIALTSSSISVVIAVLGAIGIKWYNFKLKSYSRVLNYIPLVLPDLIIGVSLLLFFNMNFAKIPLGMLTVFIAHTTFNIPFSLFIIMSRIDEFDFSIVEASRDLGATELQTLNKVILPTMVPGIISALLILILCLYKFILCLSLE